MAPQYAPSLRSRLVPMLLVLQLGFILIYAFYIEIESNIKVYGITFSNMYPEFHDVTVMVILGFGYMCTFLVRYGFSGSGFNLLVTVIAIQWAIILNGIKNWYYRGKIRIDLKSLVVAEMCAASALISIGVVLGKTNPVHLILIALLEVSGFVLNEWLLQTLLKKVDRKTGLFSILGTLFLCVFWPSLNSVLVDNRTPGRRLGAVLSTYLALAVSAVTAAAVSSLSSPEGKLNPIHLQSCMLAGGVSIGVSMPAVHQPWEAMTIGFTAAVVSTIGFRYLKSHMLLAFKFHDTCAVLSTHGLPGLLGWLAHLLLQIKDCDDHTTAIRFAVFHICSLITISLSLCMGIITGLLLKWNFWRPPQDKKCFDDQAFWEFLHLAVQK
ncbi:hypothetical protein CesoFtcFv8_017078 [Champsocephalus esox]|uniref:Ammonium transporter AmtB-like domain-containing protein n=1 Tax=Champsocephalus esox TaxID=159716 RepID=A0AAN8GQD3_9TELE|nr:hypothetical protein CesoFtcFv8_017078 [Champsocephalus esox]